LWNTILGGINHPCFGPISQALKALEYGVPECAIGLDKNFWYVLHNDNFGAKIINILEEVPVQVVARVVHKVAFSIMPEGTVARESLAWWSAYHAIDRARSDTQYVGKLLRGCLR